MAHDVFISYSSRDQAIADALCTSLEGRGLRCWIAPRDITPGTDWGQAIIDAISAGRVMVLLFSSHANQSEQVKREVSFAVSQAKPIVPLRIEKVQPSGSMLYFLGTVHWQDALQEPLEPHLQRLGEVLDALLGKASPSPAPQPAAPPLRSLPPRNSLGQVLLRVPEAWLPADHPPEQILAAASTCVSNADYLEFVRAGGPEPRGSISRPWRRTWVGKKCPESLLDHPVVYVAHADALLFCDWLTEKERLEGRIGPHERYTLPTLAQWLAWARQSRLPREVITDRDWPEHGVQPTAPVSWGEARAFGLQHLFGNVFEWCVDRSHEEGERWCMAIGGGWASTRDWLAAQVKKRTYGQIWRQQGLPMKDGGFRICRVTEAVAANPA